LFQNSRSVDLRAPDTFSLHIFSTPQMLSSRASTSHQILKQYLLTTNIQNTKKTDLHVLSRFLQIDIFTNQNRLFLKKKNAKV